MNKKIKTQIKTIIEASHQKWNLLNPQEPVLFAISGGKDSLSMLDLLYDYFDDFKCLHVSISSDSDLSFIPFVEQYSPIEVIQTQIMQEVKSSKKNPCFICSRRRNQAIFEYAQSQGIKKVFFGHNREDVTETLIMNMLYSNKISTMLPKQPLFGGKIEVVRPLYEVPELLLSNYAKDIPAIAKSCEFDGHTKREYVKMLINKIYAEHPDIDIRDNLYKSILNIDLEHLPL
ncbi:hypothetical protein JEZ13_09255 [bacterium]|nr:hypothetical protein [bacterium]